MFVQLICRSLCLRSQHTLIIVSGAGCGRMTPTSSPLVHRFGGLPRKISPDVERDLLVVEPNLGVNDHDDCAVTM